ncbi:hypothetical protein CYY_004808 [Polysphondylium violaceum]|uniref:Choline transporter-like protein n=1 Tax=Polysphondylium violaceum TaxID=133409 RepID=A0A8J4PXH9_9MYCE|nr:hypothetical protein CYY_004808 [Polysphondylium violaceum]
MWAPEEDLKQPLLNGKDSGSSNGFSQQPKVKTERKCNDILFLILFLGVIAGMGVVSGIAYKRGDPSILLPQNEIANHIKNSTESFVISKLENAVAQMRKDKDILIYSVILAVVLGAVWIELLKTFTRFFIYFTLCLGVALVAVLGILFVGLGRKESSESTQIVGFCLIASTILLICVIVYLRKSIDLTCAMFTETCRGVQRSPSVFIVAGIVVLAFVGFLAYWTSSFVYLFSIPGHTVNPFNENSSADINLAGSGSASQNGTTTSVFNTKIRNLMYFMIFGFCWVTAFISAVFQHTVAGTVSHWYFSRNPSGETDVGSSNAFGSLGKALTTSLGSLAFGSLIIGFIEFMQFILQVCKNTNSSNKLVVLVVSCIQCIVGCIEAIVRWINKFGYIYVAMHGTSFCTSTRTCFDLISRNMFSAIVMDFIGSFVLLLGKILGSAASALFTTGLLYGLGRSLNPITIGLSALFAFCIFNLFTHIIGIGTDTIFVCYLEDLETNGPNNLYISPDLHDLLQEKASKSNEGNNNKSSNV